MPATALQIEANRANAALSTGPRSEQGKANSSRNATRHGLTSATPLILPGEEHEYETLTAALLEQIEPNGATETLVCSRLIHAAWMLHRCDRIEADLAVDLGLDPFAAPDPDQAKRATSIEHYRGRAERTMFRCFKELRALQSERAVRQAAILQDFPLPAPTIEEIPSMASLDKVTKRSQPASPTQAAHSTFKTVDERFLADQTEENEAEQNEANSAPTPIPTCRREGPKPGRNTLCPCGSQKKYKRCCGQ